MNKKNQEFKEFKKNIKLWKKAYSEILGVCEKYSNFSSRFGFYDIENMKSKANNHLLPIEWYERF